MRTADEIVDAARASSWRSSITVAITQSLCLVYASTLTTACVVWTLRGMGVIE